MNRDNRKTNDWKGISEDSQGDHLVQQLKDRILTDVKADHKLTIKQAEKVLDEVNPIIAYYREGQGECTSWSYLSDGWDYGVYRAAQKLKD